MIPPYGSHHYGVGSPHSYSNERDDRVPSRPYSVSFDLSINVVFRGMIEADMVTVSAEGVLQSRIPAQEVILPVADTGEAKVKSMKEIQSMAIATTHPTIATETRRGVREEDQEAEATTSEEGLNLY